MKITHNENSRVKIPGLIHLTRLGYDFISIKNDKEQIDKETNIFIRLFKESLEKINKKKYSEKEISKILNELSICLGNEDLGKSFYEKLTGDFSEKLIDFKNIENNNFNIVTELTYKKDDDEFRPDIIILINGMPLAFIEVKIPNNREGLLAERKRIHTRFTNKNFRKFSNITQLLVFSNNMDYDTESIVPIEGAFYAVPSYEGVKFNCFREKDKDINDNLKALDIKKENEILRDTNLLHIGETPEYKTNLSPNTPTNKILTSLFLKERIMMLLKYGFAYVDEKEGLEKHIMRYPQLFATNKIEKNLEKGIRKGIIWHTQGSGKTALSYFNVKYLKDYFQKKKIITKFYFIVDRIELMTQAGTEFSNRGLKVEKVSTKQAFIKNIQSGEVIAGSTGKQPITVINIHKFSEESVAKKSDYATNVQRIYFLDEVHRSYKPRGNFLSNLMASDPNAILIGLTGTPLIDKKLGFNSKEIFGDYFHKYYYNLSIADGYTLKLLREEIETKYKEKLQNIYNSIEKIKKGSITKREIFSHKKFVKPMTDYIIENFKESRMVLGDNGFGGMVVCDSSDQARKIYSYLKKIPKLRSALVLHDEGTKDDRKKIQEDFKKGKIDLLVVYNMLLTGFDAKRLKKLYLARTIKLHNLLQTLTRVNRPYNNFKYGYVVDFADIKEEFDRTNREYLRELKEDWGDEGETYSNIFADKKEIEKEINNIRNKLFKYDLINIEEFQKLISKIHNKKEIIELKNNLGSLKELYNIVRVFHPDMLKSFDFSKIGKLYSEVENRLNMINLKAGLDDKEKNIQLLNVEFENIDFVFNKKSEEELIIADKLQHQLIKTQREMKKCFDLKDPIFTTLYEEFMRIFRKKNIEELTNNEMNDVIGEFEKIFLQMREHNLKDEVLSNKYYGDKKFARVHKQILRRNDKFLDHDETKIHAVLTYIKKKTDERIENNRDIILNESYFRDETQKTVIYSFEENGMEPDMEEVKGLTKLVIEEYYGEIKGND